MSPPSERVAAETTQRRQRRGAQGGLDAATGLSIGTPAIVVHPDRGRGGEGRDPEARLAEAVGLAAAIALDVRHAEVVKLRDMRAATLFGAGQIERLAAAVAAHEARLVVVDGAVTPIQQRNLETALKAKVIDRTGLILEIFGERASTSEGVLQVELAHLNYQASRLVRSWTHLERQRGGFGFLGGPGESQIETDRRLIRDRIARLKKDIEAVRRTRTLQRQRRKKAPYPVVALVGYTNAGKSTLFNRLTGAAVMAEDVLFATLDPTMRAVSLPGVDKAILSDTVGFVSDLPTELVAAFRATLEEVLQADVIVHVRDIAHPDSEAQRRDVETVLRDLGAIETPDAAPVIVALNKIDLLDAEARAALTADTAARDDTAAISAQDGKGVDALAERVAAKLTEGHRQYRIALDAADGAAAAWLHAHGEVLRQEVEGERAVYEVRMAAADHDRFAQRTTTCHPGLEPGPS